MASKRRKAAAPVAGVDFSADPLLVGGDRDFAALFPPGVLAQAGVIPLRRFRDVGLVCVHSRQGTAGLGKAQKAVDLRLVEVPAIHDFGVELFLRYMDKGAANAPPLWVPDGRRGYLERLGDFRTPRPATLMAALLLTSPLAATCPLLVGVMGKTGHALYLHGTAGLKSGLQFPAARLKELLERLKLDFDLDGGGAWQEGRGRAERGLEGFEALHLPLEGPAFVVEPRGNRR
jgi:hypothetical protein